MQKKLKAFIGIAIISLSLFAAPVGVWFAPNGNSSPIVVQANVAYAEGCGLGVNSELSISECLIYPVFWLTWNVAALAGRFVDFFLDYSISSTTYSNATQFVSRGWALVRDICNIFFIFALLYIAIGTILNLSQVNTGKMLVKVIIIALLINFSLFFTKIVIDASNILARAFVGSMQINVENTGNSGNSEVEDNVDDLGGSSVTQFSVAIMSKFKAQNLISEGDNTPYDAMEQASGKAAADGFKTTIYICGIVLFVILIYVFIMVGLLFLARVIGLWITMITAPLAFVSIILPFNIPKMGHQEWFKNLFSYAFMAPIFLFFMYLIIMFLDTGFIDSAISSPTAGVGEVLLFLIVPFALVAMLIIYAKKVTETMAGEIGGAVVKAGGAVMGLATAAVGGAAALGLRSTVGAVGSKMAESKMGGRMGRLVRSTGKKMESSDMDWRNTSAGKAISKSMGLDTMGMGSAFAGKGGGIKGSKERYAASREADARDRVNNATSGDRSELEDMQAETSRFNEIFGEEIANLEKAIVKARDEAKDNKDPAQQATLDANLVAAKAALATKTSTVEPGFTKSIDDMNNDVYTKKKDIARKVTQERAKAGDDVEGEWFTFRSQSTREDVAKRVRRGGGGGTQSSQ